MPVSIQLPAHLARRLQIDPAVSVVINQGTYVHGILVADGTRDADYRACHAAHASQHYAAEDSKGFLHSAA